MLNKVTIKAIILSILAVTSGIILNFEEYWFGSPVNTKNLIITFVYIAIWIFVLIIGIKTKSRKIMIYCFLYWILTLFFSILIAYINVTEASIDWAIPFVIIFLGPLYGIMFFVEEFLNLSIIIALISFGISTTTIILFKRINN